MKIITPFVTFASFFLCSACVASSTNNSSSRGETVFVGESITVTLEGNPSTGYSWSCTNIEELKDKVDIQISVSQDKEKKPDLCGVPAQIEVKCTPIKEGSYTVKLAYARPWEKGVKPVKIEEINLKAVLH